MYSNSPKQHNTPAIEPSNLKKWNWGACLLGVIWLIGMRLWAWAGVFIMVFVICRFVPVIHNQLGTTEGIGMGLCILLGFKGNELAWNSAGRHWESAQQFEDTQKAWRNWGIGLLCVFLAFAVLLIVLQGHRR